LRITPVWRASLSVQYRGVQHDRGVPGVGNYWKLGATVHERKGRAQNTAGLWFGEMPGP